MPLKTVEWLCTKLQGTSWPYSHQRHFRPIFSLHLPLNLRRVSVLLGAFKNMLQTTFIPNKTTRWKERANVLLRWYKSCFQENTPTFLYKKSRKFRPTMALNTKSEEKRAETAASHAISWTHRAPIAFCRHILGFRFVWLMNVAWPCLYSGCMSLITRHSIKAPIIFTTEHETFCGEQRVLNALTDVDNWEWNMSKLNE